MLTTLDYISKYAVIPKEQMNVYKRAIELGDNKVVEYAMKRIKKEERNIRVKLDFINKICSMMGNIANSSKCKDVYDFQLKIKEYFKIIIENTVLAFLEYKKRMEEDFITDMFDELYLPNMLNEEETILILNICLNIYDQTICENIILKKPPFINSAREKNLRELVKYSIDIINEILVIIKKTFFKVLIREGYLDEGYLTKYFN